MLVFIGGFGWTFMVLQDSFEHPFFFTEENRIVKYSMSLTIYEEFTQ
jgi:hypothetical protein